MEVLTPTIWKTSTCLTTFARPDLTTFCRLEELGLGVSGQRLEPDWRCWPAGSLSPTSGVVAVAARAAARPRDPAPCALAVRWSPTVLEVTIRRYGCTCCGARVAPGQQPAAEPRAGLSRRGLRRALEGIVCQHVTVARVAEGLGGFDGVMAIEVGGY